MVYSASTLKKVLAIVCFSIFILSVAPVQASDRYRESNQGNGVGGGGFLDSLFGGINFLSSRARWDGSVGISWLDDNLNIRDTLIEFNNDDSGSGNFGSGDPGGGRVASRPACTLTNSAIVPDSTLPDGARQVAVEPGTPVTLTWVTSLFDGDGNIESTDINRQGYILSARELGTGDTGGSQAGGNTNASSDDNGSPLNPFNYIRAIEGLFGGQAITSGEYNITPDQNLPDFGTDLTGVGAQSHVVNPLVSTMYYLRQDFTINGVTRTRYCATVVQVRPGSGPECSDTVDNLDPEDNLADRDDPGCWTDPSDPTTYDPTDPDETNTTNGTMTATNCTIPENQSTCDTSLNWTSTNLTDPNVNNENLGTIIDTTPAGTNVPVVIPFGATIFTLHNGSISIDTAVAVASCAAGTSWDGLVCAAGGGSGGPGPSPGPGPSGSGGPSPAACVPTITINPSVVRSGESFTLAWDPDCGTGDPSTCVFSDTVTDTDPTADPTIPGSVVIPGVDATVTYSLICDGGTSTADASVLVLPRYEEN